MDGAFDVAADRQFFRDDVTLHLCAFGEARSARVRYPITATGAVMDNADRSLNRRTRFRQTADKFVPSARDPGQAFAQ